MVSNANRLRAYKRPNLASGGGPRPDVEIRVEIIPTSLGEQKEEEEMTTPKVKDVVCEMEIDPKDAAATMERQGKTYHFCSAACHDKFMAEPEK